MKSKATQIELNKLRQIQRETDLKCHNFNINGNSDTLPLATSFRQKYINNVVLFFFVNNKLSVFVSGRFWDYSGKKISVKILEKLKF